MGLDMHGTTDGKRGENEAIEQQSRPEPEIIAKKHAKAATENDDDTARKHGPGHAGDHLTQNIGHIANWCRLEFVEDMPVETGNVDLAGDGEGLGHTGHGDQAGQQEFQVTVLADVHMFADSIAEGDEVKQG